MLVYCSTSENVSYAFPPHIPMLWLRSTLYERLSSVVDLGTQPEHTKKGDLPKFFTHFFSYLHACFLLCLLYLSDYVSARQLISSITSHCHNTHSTSCTDLHILHIFCNKVREFCTHSHDVR